MRKGVAHTHGLTNLSARASGLQRLACGSVVLHWSWTWRRLGVRLLEPLGEAEHRAFVSSEQTFSGAALEK